MVNYRSYGVNMGGNINKYDNTVNNSSISQILEDFYNRGSKYKEYTGYSYDPKDLIGRTGDDIRRDMLEKNDNSNSIFDEPDALVRALVKAWSEDHPGEVLSGTQFNKLSLMGYNAYSQIRNSYNPARLFSGSPSRDNITQGMGFIDLNTAYKNDPAKVKYYFDQNKDLGFDPNMSIYENVAYNGGNLFADMPLWVGKNPITYAGSSKEDKDNFNKKLSSMVSAINYNDNFQKSWELFQKEQQQEQQKAIEADQAQKLAGQQAQKKPYVRGSGIAIFGESFDPEWDKQWRGGHGNHDFEW